MKTYYVHILTADAAPSSDRIPVGHITITAPDRPGIAGGRMTRPVIAVTEPGDGGVPVQAGSRREAIAQFIRDRKAR